MKKIVFQLILSVGLTVSLSAQQYDDGYVTNGLPVNVNSEKYQSFVKGFNDGLDNVVSGVIRSNDDIIQTYGINLLEYPKLNDVVANGNWDIYNDKYSAAFLRDVQNIFSRVGTEYDNISGIRSAFKDITNLRSLSPDEAEALAAIDISVQEISRRFLTSFTGASLNSRVGLKFASSYGLQPKLPGWVRCVLGIVGDAIIGGFGGIKVGTMIGGALGGAIGGVIGAGGGVFVGASKYC